MDPNCIQNRLTDDERSEFETNGYLIVENAVHPALIERLIAAIDRIDHEVRLPEQVDKLMSIPNVLHRDDAFLELVDLATTLPKVWDILGWNIYSYHSHLDVTPPANMDTATWEVSWHQDSMRVNDEIETHPRPRLSLKIGFYLTDVSEPNRGNTLVVKGSHLADELECPEDGRSNPAGAEPLCMQPGSALILDRRTWHSRSFNASDLTRKVVWLGYSYRWMQPKDEMTVQQLYSKLDPIQRQLLGDRVSANGVYDPLDDDVPLRSWLLEHQPDAGAWTKHKRPQSRPPAMVRGGTSGRQ